ncbi:AAA family ATPase [Spirosoma sp. SC4-14]|uniref:AAA family ATPase n=1 Tax=Spirosoma sp. SC4-14 TaxID=3128900 RepID=UPI0030CBF199
MFNSIEINSYRNIELLQIKNLSNVNLFVGKNNTGKTSILEAISIAALSTKAVGDYNILLGWIFKLINNREGDFFINLNQSSRNVVLFNKAAFASVMHKRKSHPFSRLRINATDETLINEPFYKRVYVDIYFTVIYDKDFVVKDENGNTKMVKGKHSLNPDLIETLNLEGTYGQATDIVYYTSNGYGFPIYFDRDYRAQVQISEIFAAQNKVFYIRSNVNNEKNNAILHENIAFDDQLKKSVTEALQLIDPTVQQFAFQTNEFGQRLGMAKVVNEEMPIPISSMGDGINRILTIILALVNCKDGFLLIDEFENGLHFSVQENLWKIIFSLSIKLNVQVFVTTHSSDTIHSFSKVLSNLPQGKHPAKAIRIQRSDDKLYSIEYSTEELETSAKFNIEIR